MKCTGMITSAILTVMALSVFAAEQKIPKSQVPNAVLQSFAKNYPNATVKSYARETKDGKTYYEIESMEGKISRDLLFEPNGTIAEVEESVPYDSLPAPVQDSISSKYGKNSFVSAERIKSKGATTYGVILRINNHNKELLYNPDGTLFNESPKSAKEQREQGED